MVHAINFGGVQKPLHVLSKTENCRSLFRCITPDALKDAGAIMENVRHHVYTCVIPLNEFSIMPNDIADTRSWHVFRLPVF